MTDDFITKNISSIKSMIDISSNLVIDSQFTYLYVSQINSSLKSLEEYFTVKLHGVNNE